MWAERGTTLRFGHAVDGCRSYIAIGGGVEVPLVFGSRSTYLRAKFGGHEGRALRSGDVLHVGRAVDAFRRGSPPRSRVGGRRGRRRWSASPALRPRYS